MAVTVPKGVFGGFYRIQSETAYGAGGGSADWQLGGAGGGATGWRDWPILDGQEPIPATEEQIFSAYKSGKRAINQQSPVPGAYSVEHSLEFPVFLELLHPLMYGVLGGQSLVQTVGAAALASTAFASVASLDTQPDGTEVLKFVIASSTASSAAVINIIQSAATVESITIGTSGSSVNGDYYSKGAYDGSSNAITFTIEGTVTSGMVVISGVDFTTGTFTLATTIPSFKLEEAGLPRSAASSMFYDGTIIKTLDFSYDRTALDGLLMATAAFSSQFPVAATAGTFANDAKPYYHPLGGWTASIKKDGAALDKVQSTNFSLDGGSVLFPVSSGNQDPSGAVAGPAQVTGEIVVVDEDATEWNLYVGQTVQDIELLFTSPNDVVDSTKYTLKFEFSELYVENYTPIMIDGVYYGATLAFRTTDDSADGPVKITSVDRMPV